MSIARHHAEWLSLVEVSGPFLSMPVLLKVFPQGLDAHDPEHLRSLRLAYEEWEELQSELKFHKAWVRHVLTQTLEIPDSRLAEGQKIPQTLNVPVGEHGEVLKPDLAVMGNDKPRLLVHVLLPGQHLEKPLSEHRWKASAATRMMELLHGTGCRLGLVTNGERWMLVDAPRGGTTGFASWYASYWLEEPITLRAFRTLLCARRFFSVPDGETLEAMLAESANNQQEVTDQLGYQVRKAVEVLIQSLDRADQDHGRQLLEKVSEEELYRAALTVMMRLVFLFSAEERGLLLLGDPLYDQHYAVSTLRAQLREAADQHGEEVLERRLDAWCRLLITFRAVHSGAWHERLKLPAYGGDLFNPDRFPFLEGRPVRDTPLPVNNRTVLHLLEALQILQVKVPGGGPAEARRLSFRALDIEQIGHVYEGLLDHTAKRANEPALGLLGTKDKEPEVPLAELERLRARSEADLLTYLNDQTSRSESALKKALAVTVEGLEAGRFRSACGNDEKLWERVRPFLGLIRRDTFDYPVVIPPGSIYVTEGTDRRTSGTYYTPKSLTEPIVQYTLEPVVYAGPAEGKPKEEWKLRSARDLLNLKICDMATGSGAFLVQACRYLAERLLEAWEEAEDNAGSRQQRFDFSSTKSDSLAAKNRPGITPFGDPASGKLHEQLIPTDVDERTTYARRLIAQRCLYGVDKNPLAVEMAKLSLWLLTMARDLPFTFLDHAIRCGDSLVGIHDLDQLRYFDLRGKIDDPRYLLDSLPPAIEKAVKLRRAIEEKTIHSVEDVQEQERLLADAGEQTRRLRIAADLLISEGFGGGQAGFICLANHFKTVDMDTFAREAGQLMGGRLTFHWPLEFPEVFEGRGGFDAIVGNPPFMGGRMIGRGLGEEYHSYLSLVRNGIKGSPDLCAYFLLRAFSLLRQERTFGLLATKSIAETGTRIVCLEQLLTLGARIFSAQSRRRWPGSASVVVAVVHLIKGKWNGPIYLDGTSVSSIGSGLDASLPDVRPYKLTALRGMYSQGQDTLGRGFELSEEERNELYAADPSSKDVVMAYYNGQDINNMPELIPYRWVIYFRDWPRERACKYKAAFQRVEMLVKPYRDGLTGQIHQTCFWKFWDLRPRLMQQLEHRTHLLALAVVTKYVSFRLVPTSNIYNKKAKLLFLTEWWHFGVLQSSFHQHWAEWLSGTLGATTLNYSTSEALETWPMPNISTDEGKKREVSRAGEVFHETREKVMRLFGQGLTDIYNRFHDRSESSTDIVKLRQLQVEMDKGVAAVYGWTDLDFGHDFHQTKLGGRYTISEAARQEVLARLLTLNHERYAEEVAQGLHDGRSGGKGTRRGGTRRNPNQQSTEKTLFGSGDEADAEPEAPVNEEPANEVDAQANEEDAADEQPGRPRPIEDFDTDEIMAAFRQATRGQGWQERAELLKAVSLLIGYQRISPKVREALKGHLRAAIRRKIIEAEGDLVRAGAATMDQYNLEDLRATLCSVMRAGRVYERQEVIHAVARYLGFVRVKETVLQPIKSAINSGIRHGILAYEGDRIWRQ